MRGGDSAGRTAPADDGRAERVTRVTHREWEEPDPAGPAPAAGDRAVRVRALRWAAALLAVLTVAATAACAGPPAKGPVHGVSLNQSRNNVVILAREPNADMSAETLVLSFLQALTGDQKDPTFSVAQEYLTNDARAQWIPAGTTLYTKTRIVDYHVVPGDTGQPAEAPDGQPAAAASSTPAASAPPAVGDVKIVSASGREYATIDENGFFQYASGSVTQNFTLKYFGGTTGWRITDKPQYRLLSPDAFKRAYQTYQSPLPVYLPSHGAPTPRMDQVYLTQAPGKVDSTYNSLARAVLTGRFAWQNTRLALQSPVTVDANGVATVRLHAPPAGMNIADVQRALAETFRDASETPQLLSLTPLTQVQVTYDGCAPAQCQAMSVTPDTLAPPIVYWVCPQGQNGQDAAIVSRAVVPPTPSSSLNCPANGKVAQAVALNGVRLAKNAPIAVKQSSDSGDVKSPAETTMAAVVEESGAVVVVSDKSTDQNVWYTAADATKVTDLEWDPVDGSLWVVDDGNLYRVRDAGSKGSGGATPESVAVPSSTNPNQQIVRFKPSPDGLRAVVVSAQKASDPSAANVPLPASMVTIARTGGEPFLDTVSQLLGGFGQNGDLSSVTVQGVTDAAWADGRTLVLLGTQAGSSTPKLYKAYLDGTQDATIIDPDDAQPGAVHLTAAIGPVGTRPALWTISDAPGANGAATTYFKRSGGSDSFTEIGSSPVVATTVAS
jgi:hypothetical protein